MTLLLNVLACPRQGCGGVLRSKRDGLLLECKRCGAPYPVLGDVPVLVPDPAGYLAQYRDAVLASLAEAGAADSSAVALVDAFAREAGDVEPQRFGDDWTAQDGHITPVEPSFASWMQHAAQANLSDVMGSLLPEGRWTVLDVGSGDGGLAARLARQHKRVLVGDLSLRAVFRSLAAARQGGGDAAIHGAVMDAHALPLGDGVVDAVLAANLVDLLETPVDFLIECARVVRAGGRTVLSVPQPEGLDVALQEAGLVVVDNVDAVPWFRVHHARHVQVYFPRVVGVQRAPVRKKRARRSA
jgi:SAM-dependent methyltransferase